MATTIQAGDKLCVVTRRDLQPGYQGVQSQHAAVQFVFDHPAIAAEWHKHSDFMAWLSVADEVELMRLLVAAKDQGIRATPWREPDVGGAITAIALEPGAKTVALTEGLGLALKGAKQP